MSRLRSEARSRGLEIDEVRRQVGEEQARLDSLNSERRVLEGTVSSLSQETTTLEGRRDDLQGRVTDLQRYV